MGSGVQWGAGRQQGQGGTFQGLPGRREGAAACRMAQGSGKGEEGGGRPHWGGGLSASGPRTKGRACPRVPAMSLPRVCPHRALRPRLPRSTGPPRAGPGRTAPHRRCAFKAATGSARERIRAEGGAGRCGRTGTGDGDRDGADGRVAEGRCGAGGECGTGGRGRGERSGGAGRCGTGGRYRAGSGGFKAGRGALRERLFPVPLCAPPVPFPPSHPPRRPGPVPTCPVNAVPVLPVPFGDARSCGTLRDGRCGPEPGPGPGTDGGIALRTAAVCGNRRSGGAGPGGPRGGGGARDPFGALNPSGCGWGGRGVRDPFGCRPRPDRIALQSPVGFGAHLGADGMEGGGAAVGPPCGRSPRLGAG